MNRPLSGARVWLSVVPGSIRIVEARGNPVRYRNCPAAVRETAAINGTDPSQRDREAMASRYPDRPDPPVLSPKTCHGCTPARCGEESDLRGEIGRAPFRRTPLPVNRGLARSLVEWRSLVCLSGCIATDWTAPLPQVPVCMEFGRSPEQEHDRQSPVFARS